MSQNKVRFAVIGAGHMGTNHIKKIRQIGPRLSATVSVIVEPDEARAQAAIRDFAPSERPIVVPNIGALTSVPALYVPDAAIVAVPASIHVEAAAACLDKGLHTLVEKPLGFSALDVKDLAEKARKTHRHLQVGLLERWSLASLWRDWRPKKDGPWMINAVRQGPFVPRVADTDVIHDLMVHDIDMWVTLDSIFNFPKIKSVRAWGRKLRSNLLDFAIVALDLEDGGIARFTASRLSADSGRGWELTGPGWHASIDFMRRSLKRFEKAGRDLNSFVATETEWSQGDPLGLEIEGFIHRVRNESDAEFSEANLAYSFCSPQTLLPIADNVLKTHEIIDEVLSCIKVLEN
jgi:predicted dehydrogenase